MAYWCFLFCSYCSKWAEYLLMYPWAASVLGTSPGAPQFMKIRYQLQSSEFLGHAYPEHELAPQSGITTMTDSWETCWTSIWSLGTYSMAAGGFLCWNSIDYDLYVHRYVLEMINSSLVSTELDIMALALVLFTRQRSWPNHRARGIPQAVSDGFFLIN